MRIPLARRVARFNRVVTNPIQGVWAGRIPPYAIVIHRGRRSGRTYRTPVVARVRDSEVTIALFYGSDVDWVRNVLAAGGGELVRAGRTRALDQPRVVDRRIGSRRVGRVLVASLGSTR